MLLRYQCEHDELNKPTTQVTRHNSHAKGTEKFLAHLAMLFFAIFIAGSYSIGALATQHMQPAPLQALRYVVSVILLGILCFGVLRMPMRIPAQPWRFLVLGFLMGVYMLTLFIALRFTNPVATGAVFTIMPLMSAGFAWLLLRQYTRPGVLAGLSLAAIGAIWVIFRGDLQALLSFDIGKGELIFFVGVICHAIYVPLIRKFNRQENPFLFTFWAAVGTMCVLLLPAAPQLPEIDYLHLPAIIWIAIAYLSIVATGLTFLLLQYGSLRLPASKVLGYGYLTPTFIIIIEGLIGHGWASAPVFLGALVTAGGLAIMAALPD